MQPLGMIWFQKQTGDTAGYVRERLPHTDPESPARPAVGCVTPLHYAMYEADNTTCADRFTY